MSQIYDIISYLRNEYNVKKHTEGTMNKYIKRITALVIALITIMSLACTSLSAITFTTGANSVSDSYRSSIYYKNLSSVPRTGDGRTDVLAVALSQIGYVEGNENGQYSGTVAGSNNYTEYNYNMGSFGSGYGGSAYPWCASFVSFCLLQAGCHDQKSTSDWCRKHEGDSKYIWREVSCNKWATQLRTCGYFKDSLSFDGDYLPIPGDLIFFTSSGVSESHIGIVLYSDGVNVYTVEGNTSAASGLETNGGGVYVKSYPLSSSYIRGYGVLPYTVNNDAYKIDYSGRQATEGLYVSTVSKYIYSSASAASYSWVLPKYSLFTVIGEEINGRLKAICTVNGNTVTGYIKNNDDRIIQLSSSSAEDGYCPLSRASAWGMLGGCLDSYCVGNAAYFSKPEIPNIACSDKLEICGWVGFSRKIESFGYYFDGAKNSVNWNLSFSRDAESAAVSLGGKYTKRYIITADTSSLSSGKHTVHYVVKLSDGTVFSIDDLAFYARQKNTAIPEAPTVLSFDKDSVTLKKLDGYEYSLGDGMWQSSNVFDGLDSTEGIKYSFHQRIAQTDTTLASVASEALNVELKKLLDLNKLMSLVVENAVLSPSFDPNVTEYTLKVENSVSQLKFTATAPDGSKMTVINPELAEGEETEVSITVESQFGECRTYIIKVTRDEKKSTETTKDDTAVTTEPPATEVPSATESVSSDVTESESVPESLNTTDALDSTDIDPIVATSVKTVHASSNDVDGFNEDGCRSTFGGIGIVIISLLAVGFAKCKKDD